MSSRRTDEDTGRPARSPDDGPAEPERPRRRPDDTRRDDDTMPLRAVPGGASDDTTVFGAVPGGGSDDTAVFGRPVMPRDRPEPDRPGETPADAAPADGSGPPTPDPDAYDPDARESDVRDSDAHDSKSARPDRQRTADGTPPPTHGDQRDGDSRRDGDDRPDGDDLPDGDGYDGEYEGDEYEEHEAPMRARRRGPLLVLIVFLAIVVGGSYLLYRSFFGAPDYDGPGQGDVILQVNDGDTTSAIGASLLKLDAVRSQKAFLRAAADDPRVRSVQPGYYRLRAQMSGDSAVKLLLDPRARVGQLEIKGGVQLEDTRGPDGTVAPGVLTQIAQATCTQINGSSTCVSADQLRSTMATSPLDALGVPGWARADVARAEPNRRLEGMVAPGRYDLRPGSSALDVLRALVSRSASQYEATGLASTGQDHHYSPYQTLVIASVIEKEGITADFDKISQVIHNRLTSRIRLEMDSTVNYPLDLQAVRTSPTDRGRAGPYNSYANYGLPPTPIAAAGTKAIEAALRPDPGPWLFFVKCRADGTSCFATTLPEHQQNVKAAQAAGVY